MKCGGCVQSVEKILLSQSNVQNAFVNLVERTALIDLKDKKIEPIITALASRGFSAKERSNTKLIDDPFSELDRKQEWWEQWQKLMISIVLLLLSVLGHLTEGGRINIPILGSLTFHAILATYALFGPGLTILKSGLKSALNLTPNMDTLVGLGVGSAYLTSISSLIWPEVGWPCFFNEPVMLLGFVLMGRFLEERARFRTGKALKELAQLQPEKARLVSKNEIREVRVGALKVGEKIQLLAGDRIPIDGIVIEGNSSVDLSSLTGESLPFEVSPGTELASGTLNLDGTIVLEVKRIGGETALARIIGLVEKAQARKAPIQSLADQVAGKFCYGVVAISLFTFIFWWKIGAVIWPQVLNVSGQGLMHSHRLHSSLGSEAQTPLGLAIQLSIAVLVVACPCALGLATPTVITVASGQAAKKGWLFRGGDVIEKASCVNQIIFDKTGTLTTGRPSVLGYLASNDDDKLIQLAASLENNSNHPISHAILQEAQKKDIALLNTFNVQTIAGKGLSGEIDNIKGIVKIGKIEWLINEDINISVDIDNELKRINYENQSIIGLALEKELLGLIVIDDQVRDDVDFTLNRLRNKGFKLSILSGDRRQSVVNLGNKLGFLNSELGWELLPEEKLKHLEELKKFGHVAMVGDGINDAPALAASDLGIAIGTGTQIAQDSSDLIILGDKLQSLPDALLLAKAAISKIKQNLFWAFGYNIIALPIAAGFLFPRFGILLSPPLAALLMATSSITVVVNALSLKSK